MEKFKDRIKGRQKAIKWVLENVEVEKVPEPSTLKSITRVDYLPDGHYAKDYIIYRQIPMKYWDKLWYVSDFKKFMDETKPDHQRDLVENDPRIVWYLTDLEGNNTHICGRALAAEGKLRYIKMKVGGKEGDRKVFGLEKINPKETIYVVEGEIDSMFLPNCVAPGDSALDKLADALEVKFSGCKVVLIYDNEKRNKDIVRQMENAIEDGHLIVIWPENTEKKDINDMIIKAGKTIQEIMKTIESNTFGGASAYLRFTKWKRW
jgi:hypothetical protein